MSQPDWMFNTRRKHVNLGDLIMLARNEIPDLDAYISMLGKQDYINFVSRIDISAGSERSRYPTYGITLYFYKQRSN